MYNKFSPPPGPSSKPLPLTDIYDLFVAFDGPTKQVTRKFQEGALDELMEFMPRNEFVCIAGTKTESTARRLAVTLWETAEKNKMGCAWLSMRFNGTPFIDERDELLMYKTRMVVFSGVLPDSSIQRIEKLRDALEEAERERMMRVLILGGMDPYSFCVDRLRIAPTSAFYLQSNR